MDLSNLKPAKGSINKNSKRVGRGQGSGKGGTATRGHKGAKSRSGYSKKIGFEGGQMPLQRRIPKFGFTSRKSLVRAEVRLSDLNKVDANSITIEELVKANVITASVKSVKVFASGEVTKAYTIDASIKVTKGAKEAIQNAGGKVEE